MSAEDILKNIEREGKEINKWGNKKIKEKDYLIAGSILIGIVFLFFIYVNFIPKSLSNQENQISVEIIEITAENCKDCFDIQGLTDSIINENNLKVKSKESLDYDSEKGKELIEKYGLDSVPALIIDSKEISSINGLDEMFVINGNEAVFGNAVPYIDLSSGNIQGLINLIEIYDPNCEECASLSQIKTQLEEIGIKINDYELIEDSYKTGKDLISENDLEYLPSLLISKDIKEYWWIFSQIKNSLIEKQNYYLLDFKMPPYKEISSGEVNGIVDFIYVIDKSCTDCFNVSELKTGFQSLGVFISGEKHVDISTSEGKNLLSKYNITAVPTVILSKDLVDYESSLELLEQVGTFEKDGSFVFRALENLNGEYREL